GIELRGLHERRERRRVVPLRERDEARRSMRDGAVLVARERFLHEKLGRIALAFRELGEREVGERRRVARLAPERLARLRDGGVELPRIAERDDVLRPRLLGIGVLLDEELKPFGSFSILAAPAPDLRERRRDLLGVGRELGRLLERRLGAGKI